MKKIIFLVLLFASLVFQTASAAIYKVYSINIGATEHINESGVLWEPYQGPVEYLDFFHDFSFMVGSFDPVGDPVNLNILSSFSGYASTTAAGSYFGYYVPDAIENNTYAITAYSLTGTPTLNTISSDYGSILDFDSSGTVLLDGVTYNFAKYAAKLNSGNLYVFYDTPLNAVQLAVPEPASFLLIAIGCIMAATMRKRIYLTEE